MTLVMFPFLVWMYVRLGHTEEREALKEFGRQYKRYAAVTPRWIPYWFRQSDPAAHPHT